MNLNIEPKLIWAGPVHYSTASALIGRGLGSYLNAGRESGFIRSQIFPPPFVCGALFPSERRQIGIRSAA